MKTLGYIALFILTGFLCGCAGGSPVLLPGKVSGGRVRLPNGWGSRWSWGNSR